MATIKKRIIKRISFDIPDLVIIEEKIIRKIIFPKEKLKKKK